MLNVIKQLLLAIWKAVSILAQFLLILVLAALAALLYALPWFLRMASVLVWLMGGYLALQSIQAIYEKHTPVGPLLALQFAVIFLMTAWMGVLLRKAPTYLWGGLLLGGFVSGWVAWQGIPMLEHGWSDADLFFRILPPALLALALLYSTIRLRWLRTAQKLKLVEPAFTWLPHVKETFSQRGTHERTNPNQ